MTKHTSYFSHDSNSRNDEKILALRMRHGAEGYGVYFMILERLREEQDYTITKDYNTLAFDFRVSSALIKSVVEDFRLFQLTPDGRRFYSQSFLERMKMKDDSSRRRSEAGRKGMQARWGNATPPSDEDNTPIPFDNQATTTHNPAINTNNNAMADNNNATAADSQAITTTTQNITRKEKKAKQSKTKEENAKPITPLLTMEELQAYLATDTPWQEIISMQNQLPPNQIANYINQFVTLLRERGETHKPAADAKSHFANWLKIKLKDNHANPDPNTTRTAEQLRQELARYAHTHVGK